MTIVKKIRSMPDLNNLNLNIFHPLIPVQMKQYGYNTTNILNAKLYCLRMDRCIDIEN